MTIGGWIIFVLLTLFIIGGTAVFIIEGDDAKVTIVAIVIAVILIIGLYAGIIYFLLIFINNII